MGNALRAQTLDRDAAADPGLLDDLVIARIAPPGGATRGDVLRDLTPFLSHRFSPSELRSHLEAALASLEAGGYLSSTRGRYSLTRRGETLASELLGGRVLPRDWPESRDVRLPARSLGLEAESAQRIKSLSRPEGLRAAILQKAYGLKGKRAPSPARLRAALAGIALERAFGNRIKGDIATGEGLSAKAGRLLAAQLARRPREFGTDSRLIAALAAEAVGAIQPDLASLRLAVVRAAISRRLPAPDAAPPPSGPASTAAPARAARGDAPAQTHPATRPAAANRPDMEGFAAIVLQHADTFGEGWPGNRKAMIVHVWRSISEAYPDWGLTEIEFKAMLTEAHRSGHIVLANADLKNKANARDIQDSAISFKNTVWHFIRTETD